MTKVITYTALSVSLPLASIVTVPPANENTTAVFYDISDWLGCSKKPQLPWCKK